MVSGTVPVTIPVTLLMHGIMKVLSSASEIWLSMVCLTLLDAWKLFMDIF